MNKENLFLRTIVLITGLFIMSFGIALSIKSNLGTTPISSVPYVYSLAFSTFSVGTWTVFLNLFFVALQILLLRKDYKWIQLLQIPFVFLFGWFVDITLLMLSDLQVHNYLLQWIVCLLSCAIMAFGIFLQVKTNITYLPGEGLIMTIANKIGREYGRFKIFFDSMLVAIAAISSFLLLHGLFGVREGTVMAALSVGAIVHFYSKNITFIDKMLKPKEVEKSAEPEPYMTTDKYVITLAREYGSGGHAVGELVAKKLGIAFYDSNLIDLTAKESGFTAEFVKENEQKLSNDLLSRYYRRNYSYVNEVIPPQDMLFLVQTKVIRDIVANESCVIVGRCADYMLKGHPNLFKVFVHADKAFRISRIITDYGVAPEDAEEVMELKDKERLNYNKYYAHGDWNNPRNYDLTIESSMFGIEFTAAMIIDARRKAIYASPLTP